MDVAEIRQELNDNLHNGMSRDEAYAIYNARAVEYKKTHKFYSDFNFLYPEVLSEELIKKFMK